MSKGKSSEELQPIDLFDLFYRFSRVFRRLWLLVVILALLGSGFFYIRAVRSFYPMYRSEAMFSINASYQPDDIFSASYYDNQAAQQLANSFPYLLGTDVMQDMMKAELGKESINGSVSASAVAGTNIFKVTVQSSNAQDAYDTLWAVINSFPKVANYMVDSPQIIIREEPEIPETPYNSFNWKSPVKRGAILGGGLGFALIALATLLSKTVTTTDQLKKTVNYPILAVLPKVRIKKRRNSRNNHISIDTHPELTETLRSLSLKLQKSLEKAKGNVVLVTSTLSGEGKTTVSTNLARTLAEEGSKVLVLDADIRSQSVAERFDLNPGRYNLIDCLKDPQNLSEGVQFVPNTTLAVLSGKSITERRYNIDAKAMHRLLSVLSREFDYVIMDSSPCAVVADTALLCHYATGVLYVVKPDCARQTQIYDSVNDLYNRNITIEGFVFNGAEINHSHYGYSYKYGYGYKYGYSYGYSKKGKSRR